MTSRTFIPTTARRARSYGLALVGAAGLSLAGASLAVAQSPGTPPATPPSPGTPAPAATPAPGPTAGPASADVGVGLSSEENEIEVGEGITYTAIVHNDGPDTAENVVAQLNFESDFDIESQTEDDRCGDDNDEQNVSCDIGTLAPGESLEIVVTGDYGEAERQHVKASVSSSTMDPNGDNNEVDDDKEVEEDR